MDEALLWQRSLSLIPLRREAHAEAVTSDSRRRLLQLQFALFVRCPVVDSFRRADACGQWRWEAHSGVRQCRWVVRSLPSIALLRHNRHGRCLSLWRRLPAGGPDPLQNHPSPSVYLPVSLPPFLVSSSHASFCGIVPGRSYLCPRAAGGVQPKSWSKRVICSTIGRNWALSANQ